MRDEADARLWSAHHDEFSDGLGRGLDRLMAAFRQLVAIQYDAPWETPRRGPHG